METTTLNIPNVHYDGCLSSIQIMLDSIGAVSDVDGDLDAKTLTVTYDHRGTTVCPNSLTLPMSAADEAVLTKIADYVLAPEVVEGAILDAIAELRPSGDTVETRRAALVAELRQVEAEQARFVAAIAATGEVDALVVAIKERETTEIGSHSMVECRFIQGNTDQPRRIPRNGAGEGLGAAGGHPRG